VRGRGLLLGLSGELGVNSVHQEVVVAVLHMHLYTFNPARRQVPDGVVLKDAEVIISNDTVKRKYNHVQTFADLFRYEMLRALGGWWVDLYLILLRPLTHLHPHCFAMKLEDVIPKASLETCTRLWMHIDLCVHLGSAWC
jgi:hypothetical protein